MTTKDPDEIISVEVSARRIFTYGGFIEMKRSEFEQLDKALNSIGQDTAEAKDGIFELIQHFTGGPSDEKTEIDYFDTAEDEDEET